jgi:tRNA G46 methylase TrmB
MAALPSSEVAVRINEANNAHIGSGSDFLRRAMQSRTVAKNAPHLTPILDSLPASAVVLEVGCGPGGITMDIAKRYPHLEVFGVDIDEASIKVKHGIRIASGRADDIVICSWHTTLKQQLMFKI